jgi:hypothetical protein
MKNDFQWKSSGGSVYVFKNCFLVGGDFNAKHPQWGFSQPNTRGRTLNRFIHDHNLKIISPPNPTYWPSHANRRPDVLDFFITTLPSHIKYTITNSSDLSSDHTPILLTLNDTSTATKNRPTITPGKTNWKKFSQTIENVNVLIKINKVDWTFIVLHFAKKKVDIENRNLLVPLNRKILNK